MRSQHSQSAVRNRATEPASLRRGRSNPTHENPSAEGSAMRKSRRTTEPDSDAIVRWAWCYARNGDGTRSMIVIASPFRIGPIEARRSTRRRRDNIRLVKLLHSDEGTGRVIAVGKLTESDSATVTLPEVSSRSSPTFRAKTLAPFARPRKLNSGSMPQNS